MKLHPKVVSPRVEASFDLCGRRDPPHGQRLRFIFLSVGAYPDGVCHMSRSPSLSGPLCEPTVSNTDQVKGLAVELLHVVVSS